jgi:hypothetical protein
MSNNVQLYRTYKSALLIIWSWGGIFSVALQAVKTTTEAPKTLQAVKTTLNIPFQSS